jgi:hypothetical protein
MPMNVAKAGKLTSAVEVSNVSPHGFWLLLGREELFVPFASFPWFRNATIGQITKVEMPSVRHLYWPDLDIDLSVDSIRDPEAFPLVAQPVA